MDLPGASANVPALLDHAPVELRPDAATMRFRPDILRPDAVSLDLMAGVSLLSGVREALRKAGYPTRILRGIKIYVAKTPLSEPEEIPRDKWATFIIRNGMHIGVCVPFRGGGRGKGKNPLNTILSIVVMAAAAFATWYIGGSGTFLGMTGLGKGAFLGGLAGTVVNMGGMLLVNALAPIPQPKLGRMGGGGLSAERSWSIEGTQNKADPYGPVPLVLGRIRFAPRLFAQPYTFLVGNDVHARYLLGVLGHNTVSDMRIGSTPLANYQGVKVHVHEKWTGQPLQFFSNAMYQDQFSIALKQSAGRVIRTTTPNTREAFLEVLFGKGLMHVNKKGNKRWVDVDFEVLFSEAGKDHWIGAINYQHVADRSVRFGACSSVAQRRGIHITFPHAGTWDVALRRLRHDDDPNEVKTPTISESDWISLRSVKDSPAVIYTGAPYTLIELEVKASEQLSGHISEFNAVFHSVCPVWDGNAWVDAPSNNPAALALMVKTTPVISRTLGMRDCDLESFKGFYLWCEKMGWAFNSVQTSQVVDIEMLLPILSAGRGSIDSRNGLLSVVWDSPDKPAVYPFGPRNSWGFRAVKNFVRVKPHALRYLFLDETADFQESERLICADGYKEDTATEIVEAQQDGVTHPDLIWKHGRLRLADSELRPELYEFNTDFAYLCVRKGSRISVTHDVTMWGIQQYRVMGLIHPEYDVESMNWGTLESILVDNRRYFASEASTQQLTQYLAALSLQELRDIITLHEIRDCGRVVGVKIDDYVSMDISKKYSFTYFIRHGVHTAYSVVSTEGVTDTLYFPVDLPVEDSPAFDGLISFGEAGKETKDLVVVHIEPTEYATAKITCQDYAANVYDAIDGSVPPFDSGITFPDRWKIGVPNPPYAINFITDEAVLVQTTGGFVPRIVVGLGLKEVAGVTVHSVGLVIKESGTEEAWRDISAVYMDGQGIVVDEVKELATYDIRLYAASDLGKRSDLSPLYQVKVIGRTTPPPAPENVHIDGTLVWWTMPGDLPIDIIGYEVLIGMDAGDSIDYAKCVTNPTITEQEFNVAAWAGRARRVWVRTVDDYGLRSEPVSVVIALGDVQIDNVVWSYRESERGWPGNVRGGFLLRGALHPVADVHAMDEDVHALDPVLHCMGGDAHSIIYTAFVSIPPPVLPCTLSIVPKIKTGRVTSIEYGVEADFIHCMDEVTHAMDEDVHCMGHSTILWRVLPDNLPITKRFSLWVRLTTTADMPTVIEDIEYIFDVEDQIHLVSDFSVPEDGARLPVPEGKFRWIKNITFGLEFFAGCRADSVIWTDRGLIKNGFVVEGPAVLCLDKNGLPVAGRIDATLQGAKGV